MKTEKIIKCGPRFAIQDAESGDFAKRDGTYGDLVDAIIYRTKKEARMDLDHGDRVVTVIEAIHLVSV